MPLCFVLLAASQLGPHFLPASDLGAQKCLLRQSGIVHTGHIALQAVYCLLEAFKGLGHAVLRFHSLIVVEVVKPEHKMMAEYLRRDSWQIQAIIAELQIAAV